MDIYRKLPLNNIAQRKTPIDVIFCLPGDHYSGKFVQSWTKLLIWCIQHGVNAQILQMYSSNIFHVRECFLSYNVILDTANVKPFGGRHYDYVIWIDSDQVFSPEQFQKLLLLDVDIVSAAIRVVMNDDYAFGWIDKKTLEEKNEIKRMNVKEMEGKKDLIDVDFCGLAFTLFKRGVLESIKFPWFNPIHYSEYVEGKFGFLGEDLSLFHRLRQKGFKVYIDPLTKVGHEKRVVL